MADQNGNLDGDDSRQFDAAIRKATIGTPEGFDWLFRTYNRPVGALVRSELCPDPDGLVNSIFFKAFRSLDRFAGGHAHFASFLYQIARFEIIDDRRARNRMVEPDGHILGLQTTDKAPGPTESSRALRVNEALDALTTEQREILVLRVYFGLTGPETAEALDRPVETIRSLQNRAEARLRGLTEAGALAR